MQNMTGYMSQEYVESLAHIGTPRYLEHSQGWILERPIPNTSLKDASGVFPIFNCNDWSQLAQDIETLKDEFVSLTLVADPFNDIAETTLHNCFPDKLLAFKERLVVDLTKPLNESVNRHHRKCARQALARTETELLSTPLDFLDDWLGLHQTLKDRNQISGDWAFSKESFKKQFSSPGVVVFTSKVDGEYVGAQVWMLHNNVAYGHVIALNDVGYKLGASYALYWFALNYFQNQNLVKYCDIGGHVGANTQGAEGLMKFKNGWTSDTVTPYLCGNILQPKAYQQLIVDNNAESNPYFPAYRII